MAFNYPYGDTQQLNLEWFINKFHEMVAEWQTAESGISGALQAEISRVEAAMSDLYNARDAAINAKNDAVSAKNAAAGSATAAYGSQTAAASSAAAAMTNALKSEGHAVGEQNGTPVSSGSPYYEDNSKYYAGLASQAKTSAEQDASSAAASAQHAQDLVDSLPSDYSDLLHQVGDQIEGEGTELSGAIVSFDDGAEGVPVREIAVDIDPVQAGSGDPSPNNIRPITGWTEANVYRSGADTSIFTTFNIKFPANAGTVYGGTLENNGTDEWTLTVTHAIVDLGNLPWSYSPYGFMQSSVLSDAKYPPISSRLADLLCSFLNVTTAYEIRYGATGIGMDDAGRLRVKYDEMSTDEQTFTTAMAGMQLVYELATPIAYNITDEQAVTLLKGTNNVWADTGDVELTYGAYLSVLSDALQTKANKTLIAPVLDDMLADTNLAINDLRIVGNTLYKVTASIANGGALTVGTNVTATTIGDLITDLLNA